MDPPTTTTKSAEKAVKCDVCRNKDSTASCGVCRHRRYCGAKCGQQDWISHKHSCYPRGLSALQVYDATRTVGEIFSTAGEMTLKANVLLVCPDDVKLINHPADEDYVMCRYPTLEKRKSAFRTVKSALLVVKPWQAPVFTPLDVETMAYVYENKTIVDRYDFQVDEDSAETALRDWTTTQHVALLRSVTSYAHPRFNESLFDMYYAFMTKFDKSGRFRGVWSEHVEDGNLTPDAPACVKLKERAVSPDLERDDYLERYRLIMKALRDPSFADVPPLVRAGINKTAAIVSFKLLKYYEALDCIEAAIKDYATVISPSRLQHSEALAMKGKINERIARREKDVIEELEQSR